MKRPTYHQFYTPELMDERVAVLEDVKSIIESGDLPVVRGVTNDSIGTNSAEQGLSVERNGDDTLIGYHVVDLSFVPVAGELGRIAYTTQETDGSVYGKLFGDKILHHKLTLAQHTDSRGIAPVNSFYFEPTEGNPTFVRSEKSIFQNSGQSFEGEGGRLLAQTLHSYAKPRSSDPLLSGERVLRTAASDHVMTILAENGWPMLADSSGRRSFHRPMRFWTDYRNQRSFDQIESGQVLLYTQEQFRNMQRYANGESQEPDFRDIEPSEVGLKVLQLINSEDITQEVISDEDFMSLFTDLDPEINGNDPMLANIMNWAVTHGVISQTSLNGQPALKFQGLERPIPYDAPEGTFTPTSALEVLHRYLGYRAKNEREATSRDRSLLGDLALAAALSREVSEKDRRIIQSRTTSIQPRARARRRRR